MALFNFLGNTVPANTTSENNTLNFGMEFEVLEPNIELAGLRVYNAVGGAAVKQGRLYEVAGQTVVAGPVNFPTTFGWVEVMFGVSVPLTMGVRYKAAEWFPLTLMTYGFTQNDWITDRTSGPGHAFSNAQSTQGQGTFNSNGVPSYPANNFSSTNYFVDVILFKPDIVPGAVVAKLPSQADLNRVFERIGIPATWPDDITTTEPAAGSGIVVRTAAVSGGSTSGGIVVQPQGNESVSANGSVTSPAADAAIATTASLTGLYKVMIKCIVTGTTVAAADTDNMDVNVVSTAKAVLPCLVLGTTGMVEYSDWHEYFIRFSAQTCVVRAVAAGTASSVYKAFIVATKVAD